MQSHYAVTVHIISSIVAGNENNDSNGDDRDAQPRLSSKACVKLLDRSDLHLLVWQPTTFTTRHHVAYNYMHILSLDSCSRPCKAMYIPKEVARQLTLHQARNHQDKNGRAIQHMSSNFHLAQHKAQPIASTTRPPSAQHPTQPYVVQSLQQVQLAKPMVAYHVTSTSPHRSRSHLLYISKHGAIIPCGVPERAESEYSQRARSHQSIHNPPRHVNTEEVHLAKSLNKFIKYSFQ